MPVTPLRRILPAAALTVVAALALSSCAGTASESADEVVWAIEGANLSAGHTWTRRRASSTCRPWCSAPCSTRSCSRRPTALLAVARDGVGDRG